MSLATRCTSCGTVFRVVQDQLKVSEGWVRCGRCDEVFNALEGLFDLERDPVVSGPLPAASTAQKPAIQAAPVAGDAEESAWPPTSPSDDWERSLTQRLEDELLSTRPSAQGPLTEMPVDALKEAPEFSNARWDAELLTDVAPQPTQAISYELDERDERDEPPERAFDRADVNEPDVAPVAPAFIRDAERQARWQRPGVRTLMGLTALLLLGGLSVQVGHHFRDTVAARWPQTLPVLQAWCAAMKCTLEPPRRIEDIAVESTTLARATNASEAYRLTVNLRNRGDMPVRVPSVDLKLTDGSGRLVARRVLSPADLGATLATLPPGADTPFQLLMSTGSLGVTGYTVEVFYP